MTADWCIRHCDQCGALESDPTVELIVDQETGEVRHLRGGGMIRCGVMTDGVTK